MFTLYVHEITFSSGEERKGWWWHEMMVTESETTVGDQLIQQNWIFSTRCQNLGQGKT